MDMETADKGLLCLECDFRETPPLLFILHRLQVLTGPQSLPSQQSPLQELAGGRLQREGGPGGGLSLTLGGKEGRN